MIVTDGFTGNVTLKLLEGLSKSLLRRDQGRPDVLTRDHVLQRWPSRPGLRGLAAKLDPDTYGGAPLLGVDGLSIVGHGSSKRQAVASALQVSAQAARSDLTERIREATSAT